MESDKEEMDPVRLPLDIIDHIFQFVDIDTQLALRKVFPLFNFRSRRLQSNLRHFVLKPYSIKSTIVVDRGERMCISWPTDEVNRIHQCNIFRDFVDGYIARDVVIQIITRNKIYTYCVDDIDIESDGIPERYALYFQSDIV